MPESNEANQSTKQSISEIGNKKLAEIEIVCCLLIDLVASFVDSGALILVGYAFACLENKLRQFNSRLNSEFISAINLLKGFPGIKL